MQLNLYYDVKLVTRPVKMLPVPLANVSGSAPLCGKVLPVVKKLEMYCTFAVFAAL